LLQCDVQLAHFNLVRDDARFVPKLVREVSVLDFLRGSDGHYYKGRSRQLLPAIPRRTKYPSNADVSTDSGSYKGNGPLQEDTTHTTDQQKVHSITMVYLTVDCTISSLLFRMLSRLLILPNIISETAFACQEDKCFLTNSQLYFVRQE
jgi:hypothetical protein